ncbi:hypothetical protein CS022_13935 [Veronia nyctiphanis]|uniref:Uncharacterized protein n=1 Tax=Veronia nyctiphanis TaxID=1278244 RepID=A0A4Q0YUM6_9GAMM|nr:hypothetical protein [Veronia nyctiphanis]RXJ72731.1 hypothetical protein CS022_13935 [Veronia nyctiphanis]
MNKKVIITMSLLLVFGMFYFGKNSGEPLQLPDCKRYAMTDTLETPVYLYVDERVQNFDSKQFIDYANQTLKNSCIPLKRVISGIEYIDVSHFTDTDNILTVPGHIRRELSNMVGKEKLQSQGLPGSYYGLVLSAEHEAEHDILGVAHMNFGNNFFIMYSNAKPTTLEHELGHLSWAFHQGTTTFHLKSTILPRHHSNLKTYARGYNCKGADTIMAASGATESLPVYSSPDIYRFGQPCGDEEIADNARQMREFAAWLKEELQLTASQ